VKSVTLTVDCPPGFGRSNSRYAFKGSKQLSAKYKLFRDYTKLAHGDAGHPCFDSGPVCVYLNTYWDNRRILDFGDTGKADVDSTVKGTLDALQHAGTIDDDVRVTELVTRKFYDPAHARTEITICSTASLMADIVRLVDLLQAGKKLSKNDRAVLDLARKVVTT
jgi:Holliday junction resolvase RusA-like endonuclease